MRRFTNPLDNIRVASPCTANWDEMFGDHRKRFCGECKLNVYNLSDMTRREAESLLINSEGRLCVRFYRRQDGTVLTQNCPVGWKAVKARTMRVAAAILSIVIGFVSGIFGFRAAESLVSILPMGDVPQPVDTFEPVDYEPDMGDVVVDRVPMHATVGRVEVLERMDKKKVVAWVK